MLHETNKLDQCFSNFNVYENHLAILQNAGLRSVSRSEVGALKFCIYNKFPDDTNAAGPETTLDQHGAKINFVTNTEKFFSWHEMKSRPDLGQNKNRGNHLHFSSSYYFHNTLDPLKSLKFVYQDL